MLKKYNIDVNNLSDKQYEYLITELKKELKTVTDENDKLQQEIINKINYIKILEELEKYNNQ